ncbi:MAG: ATP-binding cassette domain-containing protein [Clostridioides difficile]|uniref:ABC transporter ATP-binding protein n=1 Tax=Clostridioides difficile TaxID=1496 RepID=UPI00098A203A|nr:ATP-binding cassette domain-containing protein [Clostridioides difficile]MCA0814997.1 ATP-binding cassette domain-containing protein [Clostridioides difficile]MCB4243591.1 ATP-binding cassette domain-containing protein [Clostridioides difficile]MCB4254470.1 ATP-binding cassette domain-containing protein [Clostridioides difficile]MCC8848559.1 ATP-binding cassette domain-containing protein [Clostridioides difficile]MCC8859579.1 ATP-binding cassette domain-containing protein [Clostridioides di
MFENLSIDIEDGEFVSIIGSNGTGKSTLLNIISGLIKESSGQITLDSTTITNLAEYKRTQIVSRVFQDPSLGTCPSMTVRENLSLALNKGKLLNLKKCLRHKTNDLEHLLEGISLDLKKYLDIKVQYLSGGQRQSLSLIMSSLASPKVLLLDEHTAALDPKTSNEVIELTDKIVREKNITTLMVTHNLKHALQYGDRLIMLHKGEVVLDVKDKEKEDLTVEEILEKFEYAV